MAAPVLAAEPEPKCGVDMPHTTGSLSFDPTTMEKTGLMQERSTSALPRARRFPLPVQRIQKNDHKQVH
jgi:hypothetical protein